MTTTGVVRSWSPQEMWGIIDSDETPGGCWTLFHSVAVEGFPVLREGHQVEFEWDTLDSPMHGCDFYTIRAWPAGSEPYVAPPSDSPFSSRVWITVTDGTARELTDADFPPVPLSCLIQPEVRLTDPRYSVWRLTKLRHRVC
ncbi:hypothetical protein FXW78_27220 [Rhodococcus opacus]|nr:hypothetical protein [Rhodococcus opacus]